MMPRRAGSAAIRATAPFLPPALTRLLRRRFSEFIYAGEIWPAHLNDGWSHDSVAAAQQRHWPTLARNLEGTGPLGVSHIPGHDSRTNAGDHNIMMSFAYVLGLAGWQKSRLSLLDCGGGCGHYLLYARALYPELEFDYHCFDLPPIVAAGRGLQPGAVFHDDFAELEDHTFDLVLAGSSLQYFEDWRAALALLAERSAQWLYVFRLHVLERSRSYVTIQKPFSAGYQTAYPGWLLNRDEFLAAAASFGLKLVREFVFEEDWYVRGAPEQGRSRGFLFTRI
ncbi:MAG TPA: methyltransferase domain-containing protein [Dehalococcoidia bacterium]|jgi:putative methyltransferase (TIGR04325 family)